MAGGSCSVVDCVGGCGATGAEAGADVAKEVEDVEGGMIPNNTPPDNGSEDLCWLRATRSSSLSDSSSSDSRSAMVPRGMSS